MNQLIPRIVIIEHEQIWIDRVNELPVIRELRSLEPSAVQSICMDQLSEIMPRLEKMEFDLLIADVIYEGSVFADFGKYIAREAIKRDACLVVLSHHVSGNEFGDLVNEFGVAGLLRKKELMDKGDAILRGIIYRRFPGYKLVSSTDSISWVHLSDLHYEAHVNANRSRVENAFLRDLKRQKDEGIQPSMVFITGDIAASGQVEQYKRAADFISRLLFSTGVFKDQLFMVPGNHDVAWNKINPHLKKLCQFKNRDDLSQAMSDTKVVAMLHTHLKAYLEFAKELSGKKIKFDQGASFCYWEETPGIGVAGINSAIGSGISRLEGGTASDKGNLFIGEEGVEKTTEEIKNHNIRLVLMHHPLSYLMDFDERDVERILCQRCDILLHGHLHVSEFREVLQLRGKMRVVPVGSIFQSRDLVNSYSIGIVDLKKRDGIIRYRRYSDVQQEFVRDLDTTGEGLDGSFKFSLRGEL